MQGEAHTPQLEKDLMQQQIHMADKKKPQSELVVGGSSPLLASEGPVSLSHLAEISVFLFLYLSPLVLYGHQSHHESPILMT